MRVNIHLSPKYVFFAFERNLLCWTMRLSRCAFECSIDQPVHAYSLELLRRNKIIIIICEAYRNLSKAKEKFGKINNRRLQWRALGKMLKNYSKIQFLQIRHSDFCIAIRKANNAMRRICVCVCDSVFKAKPNNMKRSEKKCSSSSYRHSHTHALSHT